MRKFFCNYNSLTERYELSLNSHSPFSLKINVLAERTLLPEIKELLQGVYDNTTLLKSQIAGDESLKMLDNGELLISNLYYSLFASPLELNDTPRTITNRELLTETIEKLSLLGEKINIPEYNRSVEIIKNIFQNLLNRQL